MKKNPGSRAFLNLKVALLVFSMNSRGPDSSVVSDKKRKTFSCELKLSACQRPILFDRSSRGNGLFFIAKTVPATKSSFSTDEIKLLLSSKNCSFLMKVTILFHQY